MHQQAKLTTNHPILGNVGDPVSTAALEKLFTSSSQANNDIGYKCADSNCGVRVIAVITKLSKAQRKNSPSSYFSAKPKSHRPGCTRQPNSTNPPTHSVGTGVTASPSRTSRPTVWVDPRNQYVLGVTSNSQAGNSITGTNSGRGGRSRTGGGVSQGRSQMIESYATEWVSMSVQEKHNEKLLAPWNPGGTYFSAFHPIRYYKSVDVVSIGEKIFVGEISNVIKTKTGYVITLSERNSTSETLWIWVQDVTFTYGASGQGLQRLLANLAANIAMASGRQVFALERFTKQQNNNNQSWVSLPVVHPHMIWIS